MSSLTMIVSPSYGRFTFDAVFRTDHMANVTVTQHPVQTGASISDHAYAEPDEVTLEIGMSDAVTYAGTNHSVNAYSQLRAIMAKREPVTLITRLQSYKNMVITSMSAPDDYTTMNALKATIYFRQIEMVSVSTITVQQKVTASSSTPTNTSSNGSGSGAKKPSTSSSSPSSSSSSSSSKKQSVLSSLLSAAKTATTVTTTKTTTKPSSTVLAKATSLAKAAVKKAFTAVALK
ncbi:MAG: hypothetical protein IJZ74_06885 [Clostridia bacterium]|nr:hypothetical protein [Clostridia bacterium]